MERINRSNDEHLDKPAIHSEWMRKLCQIKEETGIPMTVLVDTAIRSYLAGFMSGEPEDNSGEEIQYE
jgi:hypothetical protein